MCFLTYLAAIVIFISCDQNSKYCYICKTLMKVYAQQMLLYFLEKTEFFLIMLLHLNPNNQAASVWSGMQSSVHGAETSLFWSSPQPNHEFSKALFPAVHLCDYRNLNCTLRKLPSIFLEMGHKLKLISQSKSNMSQPCMYFRTLGRQPILICNLNLNLKFKI